MQQCHSYSIKNDQTCQQERQFEVRLSLLSSNDTKIRLDPSSSTTTIVIDDRRDEECCKLSFQINQSPFASFRRGQPPARHTKVVNDDLRPIKTGQARMYVLVCADDATPSNPTTPGRGVADVHAHTTNVCSVLGCGSVR